MSATEILLAATIKEARARGLRVSHLPSQYPVSPKERRSVRRWILINGNLCQIVPTRVAEVRNPKESPYPALQLYVPRSTRPSFVIYVADAVQAGVSRFYIVPRVNLRRDTFFSLDAARAHADAWDLLKDSGQRRGIAQFEALPVQTRWVIGEARRHGLDVKLIPSKPAFRSPPVWKERLYVNGYACQVMIATRGSSSGTHRRWRYVYIRTPRGRWQPEFLIYVVWGPDKRSRPSLYVVPRGRVIRDTTTSLTAWLPEYHGAWYLLGGTKRSRG